MNTPPIPRRPVAACALLLLGLAGVWPAAAQWHHRPSEVREEKPAPALAIGKKLFVERCGRCHNERGDKPLPDGPPLNERKLTREGIVRAVDSRMRDKTGDERRAVVDYIESFLKTRPLASIPTLEEIAKFG
ncbi:MAG TPA: cytochrome c [Candidatus Xenobia bacterium]|nr:cytochrome c [Candidatus Xenobia bacterium]